MTDAECNFARVFCASCGKTGAVASLGILNRLPENVRLDQERFHREREGCSMARIESERIGAAEAFDLAERISHDPKHSLRRFEEMSS